MTSTHITVSLHLTCLHYHVLHNTAKDDGDKKAGKLMKMHKDPVYLKFVDQVNH